LVAADCRSNKFGGSAIGKSFGRGKLPLQHRKSWQVATPTNSAVRQSANRLVAADCRSNIASRGKLPLQQIRQFGNRQVVWSRQIAALTSQVVADCRSNKFGGSAIGKSFGRGRLPP